MNVPKLCITAKKYTEESTVISVRMPKDMLRDLDDVAAKTGRTRNEILTLSVEFALNNLKLECPDKKQNEENINGGN